MKVYILTGFGQEGEIVLGVYSSEAKADKEKEAYRKANWANWYKFDYFTIQERTLDVEADDDHL